MSFLTVSNQTHLSLDYHDKLIFKEMSLLQIKMQKPLFIRFLGFFFASFRFAETESV